MAYLLAVVSALVSGLLFAVVARLLGVEHQGILFAIAIVGAVLQALFLVVWFLFHSQPPLATVHDEHVGVGE